jgi:hypothetical protein
MTFPHDRKGFTSQLGVCPVRARRYPSRARVIEENHALTPVSRRYKAIPVERFVG